MSKGGLIGLLKPDLSTMIQVAYGIALAGLGVLLLKAIALPALKYLVAKAAELVAAL